MRDDLKRTVKIGSFTLFFLLIAIYALFGAYDLLTGVKIKNVVIDQKDAIVNISGNAKNAVKLSLNGREISVDQGGHFNETLVLTPGFNPITIRAVDKFGNTDEKNYELTR